MAKDPAFLFYPGDWMGGTMILSRHQKGCYIDLLIAQFNNGPLALESIKNILGQDQAAWTVLSGKFRKDSNGNYFNERLAAEIEKRKKFSESRRENGKNGGRPKKPLDKPNGLHVHNLPENENRNENEFDDPLNELEAGKCVEFSRITLHRAYDSDRIQQLWEAFCIQHEKKFYPDRDEKIKHFRNWIKTQPDDQKQSAGSGKQGTSKARTEALKGW